MRQDYDSFKRTLLERLEEKLDPGFVLNVNTTNKINGIQKTGITLNKGVEPFGLSPNIYIEDLYDRYSGYNMNDLVDETYSLLTASFDNKVDVQNILSAEYVRDNVYLKVISSDDNFNYLLNHPYIQVEGFDNLVAIAVIKIEEMSNLTGSDVTSAPVNDNLLELLDISKKELFEYAKNNSMSNEPAEISSMKDKLLSIMFPGGVPEDDPMVDAMFPDDLPMYVVSNKSMMWGASTLMYDGILEQIHDTIGDDYVILPSSIHEVIVVKQTAGVDTAEMVNMVKEINGTVLSPEEVLSNSIYQYNSADNSITTISDAAAGSEAGASI